MSIFKRKSQLEKDKAQLEKICAKLKDKFVILDVDITVDGKGKYQDEIHEGKLFVFKNVKGEQ